MRHRRREFRVKAGAALRALGKAFGQQATVAEMARSPGVAGKLGNFVEPATRERDQRQEPQQRAPRSRHDLPCRIAPCQMRRLVREHGAHLFGIEQIERPARQRDAATTHGDRTGQLIEHGQTRRQRARLDRKRCSGRRDCGVMQRYRTRKRAFQTQPGCEQSRENQQDTREPRHHHGSRPRQPRP